MAWVDTTKTFKYEGYLTGSDYCDGFIKTTLQYDKDSVTPTSINIRFKIDNTKSRLYWKSDDYYIYWNPGVANKEKFFCVKKSGEDWPDYSDKIKLTKGATDSSFKIPEFWICHTGSIVNANTLSKSDGIYYITYGDAGKKTVYYYFTNNRKNFKTVYSSFELSGIPGTVATEPTVKITYCKSIIKDGYFKIAAKGDVTSKGTGAQKINKRVCGIEGKDIKQSGIPFTDNSEEPIYLPSDIGLYPSTSYTVSFSAINDLKLKYTASKTIKTLALESPSGKCRELKILPDEIYTSSALTFSWKVPSSDLGTNVGKFGYRIRVFKNDENITKSSVYYLDKATSYTDISIPGSDIINANSQFNVGDVIKFEVTPYINYLDELYIDENSKSTSAGYKVNADASSIWVKDRGVWKSGKIWVNIALPGSTPEWKAAKYIYVKSNGIWKRS